MTDDKLYTSLSANTIMAKLTNQFQWTRHITSSPDKHYSLVSEDDFRSGCRNVSHQQQFFSELPSPGRSHYTNYWYSWVQTIHNIVIVVMQWASPLRDIRVWDLQVIKSVLNARSLKNLYTGDIHLVLHKDSCHKGNLELAYPSICNLCRWGTKLT